MKKLNPLAQLTLCLTLLNSCGYLLQGSYSPLQTKEDIHTVYVKPFTNATTKPGIENVMYNAAIKAISSGRRLKIVYNIDNADAELSGSVNGASLGGFSESAIPTIEQNNLAEFGRGLTTTYMGTMSASFSLSRVITPVGKSAGLWGGGFSRGKPFASSARIGPQGATSALINESEFDRALLESADRIADDMHEAMLAQF